MPSAGRKLKGLWIPINIIMGNSVECFRRFCGVQIPFTHCVIHALAYFCICDFSGELFVKIAKDMITETAKGIEGLTF